MNIDTETVRGFGDEWTRFHQADLPFAERLAYFNRYFRIFPWSTLPVNAVGFDLGCGSGRWADLVAERVGTLHCIDASEKAIVVAKERLVHRRNCVFHNSSVDDMDLADGSMDFGYSLGVLHHVPDTQAGIASCVSKLRKGAPFLLYLYYAFDDRPGWFKAVWKASDGLRRIVARLPWRPKLIVSQMIAAGIYWPAARAIRLAERRGASVEGLPLAFYRNASFYTMRTDALDRFGTRLEKRFSAEQIRHMMGQAGLTEIQFSDQAPYWCAMGVKQ